MVIGGATGPMDIAKRRPHIDWIHTALVQGNAIRDYVKWDDQPFSPAPYRTPSPGLIAWRTRNPRRPTYICFDVPIQEEPLEKDVPLLDVKG